MSTYNAKVYHYKHGTQVRLYTKPIEIKENKSLYEEDKNGQLSFKEKKKREFYNRQSVDPEESIRRSQNRSKNMIYQIARSNNWDWYVTLTLNKDRVQDRLDYDKCIKDLSAWLRKMKNTRAPDLKYLIVPEEHKNGGFHFHGLFANTGYILFIDSGKSCKVHTGDKVPIYNIVDYTLGFSNCSKVYKPECITAYICKYMTKEICEITFNKKRYLASRNCEKPETEVYQISNEDKAEFLSENCENVKHLKDLKISKINTITYIEL